MWHVWGRRDVYIYIFIYLERERECVCVGGETLGEKDLLKDLGVDGGIILNSIFIKWDGKAGVGLIWLRIGTEDT